MRDIMQGIYYDDSRSDDKIMRFPCQKGNGGTIDDKGFHAGWVMCNLWHFTQEHKDAGEAGFRWYTDRDLFAQAIEIGRYGGYEMTVPDEDSPEWNTDKTTVWVEFGYAPRPEGSTIWHRD